MRWLSIGLVLAAAACGRDVGAPGIWVPWDEIDGGLRPELVPSPPTARQRMDPTRVRVVTFNVETGGDDEALATALMGHPELASADLFLLQEEEGHPMEGRTRTARLAERMGLAYAYVPARLKGEATHGLAILSVFPIDEVAKMDLPASDLLPRIAIAAVIRAGETELRVINVHLDTVLNVTDRILQLRPAVIDAPPTLLVAGDFNTNGYVWANDTLPVLPAASVAGTDQAPIVDDYMRTIGFDTPTAELGATEHMFGVESRLDSIYARGLTVEPGAVERAVDVSDHWPLWVDVRLP